LIDLAGAERPDKAGGERVDGPKVFEKMISGKPLDIGD
jgi:hypothetical protein